MISIICIRAYIIMRLSTSNDMLCPEQKDANINKLQLTVQMNKSGSSSNKSYLYIDWFYTSTEWITEGQLLAITRWVASMMFIQ